MPSLVVSDYKDTNFWKQFTTRPTRPRHPSRLFQTTKIQTFESNSQRARPSAPPATSCFRLQRYKLLKAIHNRSQSVQTVSSVVSDYKDTNFWKQFTTICKTVFHCSPLFQTTKIQTFESNSQQTCRHRPPSTGCFRLQRYKLLKAIHNDLLTAVRREVVVSDYKDTNFWKQFTTYCEEYFEELPLFQTTKIQTFESNSQHLCYLSLESECCFRLQRYKLLKAIHNYRP